MKSKIFDPSPPPPVHFISLPGLTPSPQFTFFHFLEIPKHLVINMKFMLFRKKIPYIFWCYKRMKTYKIMHFTLHTSRIKWNRFNKSQMIIWVSAYLPNVIMYYEYNSFKFRSLSATKIYFTFFHFSRWPPPPSSLHFTFFHRPPPPVHHEKFLEDPLGGDIWPPGRESVKKQYNILPY